MVNTVAFSKRLQMLIDFYDLSASAFADKIEFNRSTISHLISGRNKPSLDFVLKVLQTFPEVSMSWLVYGEGKFPESSSSIPSTEEQIPLKFEEDEIKNRKEQINSIQEEIIKNEKPLLKKEVKSTETLAKEISRIVIFYKDGTFEAYEN